MANEKIVNRENLKAFRQAFQEKLENGQIQPARAKNLAPLSNESGTTQDTPFILQGTGTANGTDSVDTADIGKHLEKQGNSVCVNNQLENGNFASTSGWSLINSGYSSFSVLNNTAKITCLQTGGNTTYYGLTKNTTNIISGHKYLISIEAKGTFATITSTTLYFYFQASGNNVNLGNITLNKKTLYVIITATSNSETIRIAPNLSSASINDFVEFNNFEIVDLYKWFGSNSHIPAYLISHPEKAPLYGITSDLAYNTGTLTDCAGRYLVCDGRNLFDGTNDIIAIPNRAYYCYGSSITLTYKDKSGNTISSETKTNETFTTPTNCYSFSVSGTGNICISIYYSPEEGGEGYDQYYAYETPKVYDTGTEMLRSVPIMTSPYGFIRDVKLPSGEITRFVKRAIIDGTNDNIKIDYSPSTTNNYLYRTTINDAKVTASNDTSPNIFIQNSQFSVSTFNSVRYGNELTNKITVSKTTNNVWVSFPRETAYDSIEKVNNWLQTNPIIIEYEIATPTTEQGTSFIEEIEINDYGTMGWLDTNNDYVSIPQGCKIFYPVDYLLLIDTLNGYVNGSVENLAKKTDLAFKELSSANIGSITSSEIVSGEFYKNNIAYSGGLTNAKYVIAVMSNGILYPMIITSTLLVVYSGTSWQASNLTVAKIYYKE